MEAFFASLDFTAFPAYGLLALAVFLVLSGKLQWHKIADDWRDAYRKSEEAGRVKDAQITELLELSRTTTQALRSLPGGDDVAETTAPVSGATQPRRRNGGRGGQA